MRKVSFSAREMKYTDLVKDISRNFHVDIINFLPRR